MDMDKDAQHKTDSLPLESTYVKWQREEDIPIHRGFWADLNALELAYWKRKGCLGTYLNLADQQDLDAYVAEIPPGEQTKAERYMYEEAIYVLRGRGATTVWYDGMPKHTFEWQAGSLFAPPLNCWRQHFNGQGDKPARFVAVTSAPHLINLFHNKAFIYDNTFTFHDRYQPKDDYYSGNGVQKVFAVAAEDGMQRGRVRCVWNTNFIPSVPDFDKLTDHNRAMFAPGAQRSVDFTLAQNTLGGHINSARPGFYKKAHRHGPGAHLIVIRGTGYTLMWEEGKKRVRVDWKPDIVFSPPDMWYHNHFCTGKEPARQFALRWGGEYIGVHRGVERNYGDQIEFEDEDPEIRKEFEDECRKNGIQMMMPAVKYRR